MCMTLSKSIPSSWSKTTANSTFKFVCVFVRLKSQKPRPKSLKSSHAVVDNYDNKLEWGNGSPFLFFSFLCSAPFPPFLFFPFLPTPCTLPLSCSAWELWKNIWFLALELQEINGVKDPEENPWFRKGLIKVNNQTKAAPPWIIMLRCCWTSGQRGPPSFTWASWKPGSLGLGSVSVYASLGTQAIIPGLFSGAATNYVGELFPNFELRFLKWNKSDETCGNWWKSLKIPLRVNALPYIPV